MVLTVAILWNFTLPNQFFHQILFGVLLPRVLFFVSIAVARSLQVLMQLHDRRVNATQMVVYSGSSSISSERKYTAQRYTNIAYFCLLLHSTNEPQVTRSQPRVRHYASAHSSARKRRGRRLPCPHSRQWCSVREGRRQVGCLSRRHCFERHRRKPTIAPSHGVHAVLSVVADPPQESATESNKYLKPILFLFTPTSTCLSAHPR